MDPIDFESLNKLSSFVGEGAQELLKQAGEDAPCTTGPSTPPPPPPGESTVPVLGSKKQTPSKDVAKGDKTAISAILPGPPPVPPVYGDDSSDDSPTVHDAGISPESSSFTQMQTVNVLPVPPPPPVIPSRLNIAVPPPPPPPPPPPSTSAAQAPVTPTLPQPSNSGATTSSAQS
ncbi:hypothetical protein COOONC_18212, partial [Cooperia oncophora]